MSQGALVLRVRRALLAQPFGRVVAVAVPPGGERAASGGLCSGGGAAVKGEGGQLAEHQRDPGAVTRVERSARSNEISPTPSLLPRLRAVRSRWTRQWRSS